MKQRMRMKGHVSEPWQYSVYEGVPPAARELIWEVFFKSRGRVGIDLTTHYPWIDEKAGVTSILIMSGHGQEHSTAVATLVVKEETLVDDKKVGLVGFVCVNEALQGRGLGRKLVSKAIEVGKDKSFNMLVLWTNKPDVYVKHGFAVDSEDWYGNVWKRTEHGAGRPFCHDPSGLRIDDISPLGIPAFAKRVLVFSNDTASITVLQTNQGYTLAAWSGNWGSVFEIIERILPNSWNLNAPANSDIYTRLESHGYNFDFAVGSQRMINNLASKDEPCLPYIPLLKRI